MEGKEEYIFLKKDNQRLLDENQKLRIENAELKDQIKKLRCSYLIQAFQILEMLCLQ